MTAGQIKSLLKKREDERVEFKRAASDLPGYFLDYRERLSNETRWNDRETVRTNLIEAFDALMAFGAKHLDDKFYLEGVQRVSVRGKILREVIANSLMHREFSSSMTARLIIERDRLFADNANRAAAHGIITPENVRPVSKNPIIAAFFKEIGRADELGSGTRNLYHYTRLYSGTDPIIDEEDAFSVTVPLNDDYSPEVGEGVLGNDITQASIGGGTANGTVNDTVNGTVNKIAELNKAGPTLADKIIEAITANSRITYDVLSAAVGMSRRTISREVKALLQQGKICRIGSDKTGHWEVVKK